MEGIIPFIILGVMVVGLLIIWSIVHERKRLAAIRQLANDLGLVLEEGKDYEVARRCEFLDHLRSGSNRYAKLVLSGNYQNCEICCFDHHHETTSTDSKGNRRTSHHWKTVVLVRLPISCPEVTIAREGLLSKIAQSLGYADIDFESHEFSRKFVVRSKDRRFTYDLIHPRMMELLLRETQRFGFLEVEDRVLALVRPGRQNPDQIRADLDLITAIYALIPPHLLRTETA